MRGGRWRPTILNRKGYERWKEDGGLDLREKARRKALEVLSTHEPAALDEHVARRIDELVSSFTPSR